MTSPGVQSFGLSDLTDQAVFVWGTGRENNEGDSADPWNHSYLYPAVAPPLSGIGEKNGSVCFHAITNTGVADAIQLHASPLATNPQDKWVLIQGDRIPVITRDDCVFAHRVTDHVESAVQLGGPTMRPRHLLNPGERTMIRDLDATITQLLKTGASTSSLLAGAAISFDLPDATWRATLTQLTVNCYLYDVHQNLEMRTHENLTSRSSNGQLVARVPPPVRVDCAYSITAWSIATTDAVLEEHDLLSQVLVVLLRNQTISSAALQGTLVGQIPPYPLVIASQDGIVKHHPEFWTALDQKLRPSLNYVITLAMMLDPIPVGVPTPFKSVAIHAAQQGPLPSSPAPGPSSGAVFAVTES